MTGPARTHALTAISPLAPRRLWLCRVVFPLLRILAMSSSLARLRFIHFARWIVYDDLPGVAASPAHRWWRARPGMVFLSDYDGDPTEYLTTFGFSVAPGMRWAFGTCEGFPGPRPTRGLVDFVERGKVREILRYSAYPDVTVREIDAALTVAARIEDLRLSRDDRRFAMAYDRLVDALALTPPATVPSMWTALWNALRDRDGVQDLTVVIPLHAGARPPSLSPAVLDTIPGIHFARLAVLPMPCPRFGTSHSDETGAAPGPNLEFLLFSTCFDGDRDEFVDLLVAGLGHHADTIWSDCVGYPGCDDPLRLAEWIADHRLEPRLFVATHPTTSVARIREVVALRNRAFDLVAANQGQTTSYLRHQLAELWDAAPAPRPRLATT
jgi:hypothetical protein